MGSRGPGGVAERSWARLLPELREARLMAVATLVYTTGSGIFMVVSVLYFTRIVGLSPTSVGVGLTIAGVFGLAAGVPFGHLADRRGPREVLILLLVLAGFAFAAVVLARGWWGFVALTSLAVLLDRGSAAVRAALIASSVSGTDRVRTRAYLRAVTNVGLALGGGIAAIALHLDTRQAYVVVLLLNAASCFGAALVTARYPHVEPVPLERAPRITAVFRDRPYVVMTVLTSALAVHYAILDVAMPLWVSERTSAPPTIVAVLFVVNTVAVVLLQVGVSSRITSLTRAVRAVSLSGLVLMAACVLFALAAGRDASGAVVVLLAAAVVHVCGELLQAASHFYLSQELAAPHAQGQYQGLASTGFALAGLLAPTVVVLLPIGLGVPGWLVLGGAFAGLGLLLVPVARWTAATRERYVGVA